MKRIGKTFQLIFWPFVESEVLLEKDVRLGDVGRKIITYAIRWERKPDSCREKNNKLIHDQFSGSYLIVLVYPKYINTGIKFGDQKFVAGNGSFEHLGTQDIVN